MRDSSGSPRGLFRSEAEEWSAVSTEPRIARPAARQGTPKKSFPPAVVFHVTAGGFFCLIMTVCWKDFPIPYPKERSFSQLQVEV